MALNRHFFRGLKDNPRFVGLFYLVTLLLMPMLLFVTVVIMVRQQGDAIRETDSHRVRALLSHFTQGMQRITDETPGVIKVPSPNALPPELQVLGPDFTHLVATMDKTSLGVTGVIATDKGPVLVTIHPGTQGGYLVFLRRFNPDILTSLREMTGLHDMQITTEKQPGLVPITDMKGRVVTWLTWHSGHVDISWLLPWGPPIVIVLLGLSVLGGYAAYRRTVQLSKSQQEALDLARRDALTNLPNRRAFIGELSQALTSNEKTSIIYLDLDMFKEVNDAFGHRAGDALLVMVAQRLRAVLNIEPARLGGDEFAVLFHGERGAARRAAQSVVDVFSQPIMIDGRQIYVGASVGLAFGEAGITGDELVRRADVAMYAAKQAGKRRWRVYDTSMDAGREYRHQLSLELRQALMDGEVVVNYQPIVAVGDGAIVAAETLARWNNPTKGMVDPDTFISLAEEGGLISELTRQILRQACRDGAHWNIRVAVNLSAAEVWDLTFVDELVGILHETGMDAKRLVLEITESYLIRDLSITVRTLRLLRELGVSIVLDDFGAGYASLHQLATLELDGLKVTYAFLKKAAGEAAEDAARAIVALANAVRLPVTAEGIETMEQGEILRRAGCTYLQGWLYGHPVDAATLEGMLQASKRPE